MTHVLVNSGKFLHERSLPPWITRGRVGIMGQEPGNTLDKVFRVLHATLQETVGKCVHAQRELGCTANISIALKRILLKFLVTTK